MSSYITTQLPKNKPDSQEIKILQRQLDLKVKNLKVHTHTYTETELTRLLHKPTIDIIARSVADGNHDLEPALEMCNDLKTDMDDFAQQVESIKEPEQVKARLRRLLNNVDDAIPSLHLSLRSIENKSGTSPALTIRASHILLSSTPTKFVVKLYSLFAANQRAASADAFTWKEEFHKADATMVKTGKHGYALEITEDINDGLYHEEGEERQKLNINVGHIDRMYYTQSGELLNIEDAKNPVLVLKVSKKKGILEKEESIVQVKEANPEIRKEELKENDWYAIGLWTNHEESDDEEEEEKKVNSADSTLSLLLLENVIKLALLEITEQMDHLQASDELISLYMK